MCKLIYLTSKIDETGDLTVFESHLPGEIKRIFFIKNNTNNIRGLHRHKKSTHAIICPVGSFTILIDNGIEKQSFLLDEPHKCLLIEPHEWREIHGLDKDSMLLCISNTLFSNDDYIYEPYSKKEFVMNGR